MTHDFTEDDDSHLPLSVDEMSDLKGQIRILEEKNTSYMQSTMELEEVKQTGFVELMSDELMSERELIEKEKETERELMSEREPCVALMC